MVRNRGIRKSPQIHCVAVNGQSPEKQAGVGIAGGAKACRNFLVSAGSDSLQEISRMMPDSSRKLARRQTGIYPRQAPIVWQPELPLIGGIVALRSEHELMHAVAQLHRLKKIVFQRLDTSILSGRRDVEPEVPKKVGVTRVGIWVSRILVIEQAVIVLALAAHHEQLAIPRRIGRVGGVWV